MQQDATVDAAEWERRGIEADTAGRHAEAEACFARALARDNSRSLSWVGLDFSQINQKRNDEAVASLRRARDSRPDCGIVAHLLNAMTGTTSRHAPADYVAFLFNSYAGHFDNHIAALQYQGPQMLAQLAARAGWAADASRHIIDLGCGTGLSGLPFRAYASRLEGVDIATAMLQQARQRGIYDHLWCGDVHAVLRRLPPAGCDAIIAADMLIYVGAAEVLFRLAHAALRPGGEFLLTVEACGNSYQLMPSARYQHSDDYLLGCAAGLFAAADRLDNPIRIEAGQVLPGRAWRFRKISD